MSRQQLDIPHVYATRLTKHIEDVEEKYHSLCISISTKTTFHNYPYICHFENQSLFILLVLYKIQLDKVNVL